MKNIDNESVIDRIYLLAKHKKTSLNRFEEEVGLNEGLLKSLKQKKSSIGSDKLVKIVHHFRDVNSHWLLTGEGEMLLNNTGDTEKYTLKATNDKLVLSSNQHYDLNFLATAHAGYLVGYSDEDRHEYMHSYTLAYHKEQTTRGFIVYGHSMVTKLYHDDVVLCRRVFDIVNESFKRESIYVVVCDEGIIIKHLEKKQEGFNVISANEKAFSPYEKRYDDIYELWKVDYIISKSF